MMTTLLVLAPAWKSVLPIAVLTAALVIGTLIAHRVWTDLKGDGQEASTDPRDLLGPLAEAYSAGQMSEEEYRNIRKSIERERSSEKTVAMPVRSVEGPSSPPPAALPSGQVEEPLHRTEGEVD